MKCIVLAAGYGTRLGDMSNECSKALLPLGKKEKKPVIEYMLDRIAWVRDMDNVSIITNNKFWKDFVKWHSQCCNQYSSYRGKGIELINNDTETNETRLGGVRDLCYALRIKRISDDILVIAGDNFFDSAFELENFIKFSNERKATAVALYDVKNKEEAKRFGIVSIDKKGKVIDFEEKPQQPKSSLVSTACYIFRKDNLPEIFKYERTQPREKQEGPGFLIRDFYPKQDIYGLVFKGIWFDIGTTEQYKKVNELFEKDELV